MPDDIHELSALYALDVLPDDERARFEAHLRTCARCREEVGALAETAAQLAYVPEGPVPPDVLRERVLLAARAEPQKVVALRRRRRPSAAVSVASAIAVAACGAAVGFGVWAASLHHSLGHARAVEAVLSDPHSRRLPLTGAAGALYVAPSGKAALTAALPVPPPGKQYEAWVISGSTARPAGVFSRGPALLSLRVRPGVAVKVTVEQAGGVAQPTTQPIAGADV
jgi:anti-sigma factor RsiW